MPPSSPLTHTYGSQVTMKKFGTIAPSYDIPRTFVLTWMDRELSKL